ncbi:DUF3040 domain-containing protein [Actinoplanes sp. NPDC049118]|uniref:DUF3040 domain-containing protein n=1 Tax=Actinoplanes sp. NPDC049118 TaxID=3155769 RepID=UPI0033D5B411
MLSKEDNRRLAQLERQLRREDPDFCARMRGQLPARRRVPISLVLAACMVWAAVLALAVLGWWGAAAVAAVWGAVLLAALTYRCRPARPDRPSPGPGNLPPAW